MPVAISTDDEGVARSDMTHEYLRAVQTYHLAYADLKRMARQSIEHSFVPGRSLWAETKGSFHPVAACAGDIRTTATPSAGCAKLLESSERAREQWKLERVFAEFEKKF
jgi:adenosine deaminase